MMGVVGKQEKRKPRLDCELGGVFTFKKEPPLALAHRQRCGGIILIIKLKNQKYYSCLF